MANRKNKDNWITFSAKDCAYIAVFVAVLIAAQLAFSAIPGVEVVTLLFITFAFCFGVLRGTIAATVFSLIRQLVFGFFPTVLILYLVYYNLLGLVFGWLGKRLKNPLKSLWLIVCLAIIFTVMFTLMDNLLTVTWYGYTARAAKIYWKASLAVMFPQLICVAISVGVLFYPLYKVFRFISRK